MKFTLPFAIIAMFATGMQVAAQDHGTCTIRFNAGAAPSAVQSALNTAITNVPNIVQNSAVCTADTSLCTVKFNTGAAASPVQNNLNAAIVGVANIVQGSASCT